VDLGVGGCCVAAGVLVYYGKVHVNEVVMFRLNHG